MKRNLKIAGIGKYIPRKKVESELIDQKLNLKRGWTYKKSGVKVRHFVDGETATEMGAYASHKAIEDAQLDSADIECIISGSGTVEQPIPCNASLIQEKLGLGESGIPCFDVNTTCLSFVQALDIAANYITLGKYETILIVSAEIASVGLNWEQKESSILFGDGAAAVVIQKTASDETAGILHSHMETYSIGAHFSEISGGGTKMHPREHHSETKDQFLFYMNGPSIFKLSAKLLPGFTENLLTGAGVNLDDIQAVIPHQASGMSLRIIRRRLNIPEERFVNVIENYGNTIAASIPIALHDMIHSQKIQQGDLVMLIGTSAGLSIGGIIFEY